MTARGARLVLGERETPYRTCLRPLTIDMAVLDGVQVISYARRNWKLACALRLVSQ